MKHRYIVVEGPIGSGKSTLAKLLADHYGATLVLEDPDANPFLPLFYRDMKRHALAAQMFFLQRQQLPAGGNASFHIFGRRLKVAQQGQGGHGLHAFRSGQLLLLLQGAPAQGDALEYFAFGPFLPCFR